MQPDPADPTAWISMDPVNGWGEVHAWLAHWTKPIVPGLQPVPGDVEIIDLSARHYRRYVEDMPSILTPGVAPIETIWRQGDVPIYLWPTHDRLPKWVGLTVREGLSRALMEEARAHKELIRLACQHYGTRN